MLYSQQVFSSITCPFNTGFASLRKKERERDNFLNKINTLYIFIRKNNNLLILILS